MKEAILIVSFGTSHENTRKRTIEGIEKRICSAFPDRIMYRAWTSKTIRSILKKRDGIVIDSIDEAFERMIQDKVEDLVVQPTHVINGYENDEMLSIIEKYKAFFQKVRIGKPMLSSQEDSEEVVEILHDMYNMIPSDEAIVFMGHGTEHYANSVYAALDYIMKEKGYSNLFVGTVESYPSIDTVKKMVNQMKPAKVHLIPLMIVAGDHAQNDMAGDEEDSWKNQFERMNYKVECHLQGLGENSSIQDIFVRHVRETE